MTPFLVVAHHTVRAGHEAEVFALVPRLLEASRAEPGVLSFDAFRQLDEPRTYVLVERYVSREAFLEHRETAHFKEIVLGQIVPRLENREFEEFLPFSG